MFNKIRIEREIDHLNTLLRKNKVAVPQVTV